MNTVNALRLFLIALCLSGLNAIAHDDPANSVEGLSQHIEEEPENADLYIRRGEQYRLIKAWPEALADYRIAAELVDDPVELDGVLGEALVGTGHGQEAIKHLNRFLKRYPDNSKALEVRGDARVLLSRHAAAATDYTATLQNTPRPKPDMYLKLARSYAAQQKYEPALETIDAGIAKLGSAISLMQKGIDLEVARENYDAALKRINNLPGKLRETPLWLIRTGDIFRLDGQEAAALESYELAQAGYVALPQVRRDLPSGKELRALLDDRLPES